MPRIISIRSIRLACVTAVIALSSIASWAARDFTPQAGTWIINEELNGEPGRGLAIDVQGNTFFMQVFGYEKNGNATFYTATGQMDGNSVTAPLMRYQGGRSFGSEALDAIEDGSPGNVTVSFDNGLHGAIQFPGESQMAIKRFEVRSSDFVSRYWERGGNRSFLVTTLDSSRSAQWVGRMGLAKSQSTREWRLSIPGLMSFPEQTLICAQVVGKDVFSCTNKETLVPNDKGPYIRSITLHIANVDITGELEVEDRGALHKHQLMGVAVSGDSGSSITGCDWSFDLYVGDRRNCNRAVTPSNGTWVIEDELRYKPGRGIAVDVQNGMAIAQVFNYRPSGEPTFHMGSGPYSGVETRFALNRYQGGRALGGPNTIAELANVTGDIALEFSDGGTGLGSPSRVRGIAEFPNETRKKMIRMVLEPGADTAQGLLGQWWLDFYASNRITQIKLVSLSRVEGNEAVSDDGAIRCSRISLETPSRAKCQWNRDGLTYEAYLFQEAGNRSESVLQVRDRNGNLTGLGNVSLD